MNRREFLKGASLGIGAGAIGAMGLYSYTPMRKAFLPEVHRQLTDFGVCKCVKGTNISETSWFDNGVFMKNVTGAGGLLVGRLLAFDALQMQFSTISVARDTVCPACGQKA